MYAMSGCEDARIEKINMQTFDKWEFIEELDKRFMSQAMSLLMPRYSYDFIKRNIPLRCIEDKDEIA